MMKGHILRSALLAACIFALAAVSHAQVSKPTPTPPVVSDPYSLTPADIDKALKTASPNDVWLDGDLTAGQAAFDQGHFQDAVTAFTKTLAKFPQASNVYFLRGRAHYLLKEGDAALKDAESALKFNPRNKEALNLRGALKFDNKDLDGALKDFDAATAVDPSFVKPYVNRGRIFSTRGDLDRVVIELTTAIKLEPANSLIYYQRGNAYAQKRDFDAAIADYDRRLAGEPRDYYARENRAAVYKARKDYQKSLRDYRGIPADAPNYASAQKEIAAIEALAAKPAPAPAPAPPPPARDVDAEKIKFLMGSAETLMNTAASQIDRGTQLLKAGASKSEVCSAINLAANMLNGAAILYEKTKTIKGWEKYGRPIQDNWAAAKGQLAELQLIGCPIKLEPVNIP